MSEEEVPEFDPAKFGDPLAERIDWTPASPGGANYRTHTLAIDGGRAVFHVSKGASILLYGFMLFGLGIMLGVPYAMYRETGESPILILPVLLGAFFVGLSVLLIKRTAQPVTFDKQAGLYWSGRKDPRKMPYPQTLVLYGRLEEVHAIQLVSEYCRIETSSVHGFFSLEVNLVLKDGKRQTAVDCIRTQALIDDAQALADFLGVPLWDASMD